MRLVRIFLCFFLFLLPCFFFDIVVVVLWVGSMYVNLLLLTFICVERVLSNKYKR